MPASFQDVKKSHQIGIHIDMRVFNAVTHTCLGRKVYHNIKLFVLKNLLHAGPVRKINFLKPEALIGLENGQSVVLERRVVIRIQVVYAEYACPIVEQPPGKVKTDKACNPG